MATVKKHVSKTKGTGYKINYYDSDGVRHIVTLYTDRETAEAFANKIEYRKYEIRTGLAPDLKPNITLFKAINQYLDYVDIKKKANTIEREMFVYNHFKKYIGDIKIRSITSEMVEDYIRRRYLRDEISPATVRIEIKTLRQFFNVLIAHKFLVNNPINGVQGPKVIDKPIRFLTIEEETALIDVIDSADFKDLIVAYLHSGARKEELLPKRFTWDCVDFEKQTIRITGKRDKTRTVPMTDTLYKILVRRQSETDREFPFDFNYQNILKKLQIYYEKAGIKNADVHTLRRTFGSRLVQKGVPIFTVSKLLGHSSVVITEKHYVSLLNSDLEIQIKKLDR